MKTIIITGANSGIGKAAVIQYAMHGYRVIMACRNLELAMPVCQEIREQTKNCNVDVLPLDLSSKQSIYSFCDTFKKKYDTLDILINNAGHFRHGETGYQQSVNGFELTFATNLLGPVLLTHLLLDVLQNSSRPVVLNACSTNIKHFYDDRRTIDFQSLSGESVADKTYNSYHLYGDSKAGLLMATFAMAKEYRRYGICVNAIMIPATKMSRSAIHKVKGCWKILAVLQHPFISKRELIGDAYYSICTSETYRGVTGKLINHLGQIVPVADTSLSFLKIVTSLEFYPPYLDNKEERSRVWDICNRYITMGNSSLNIIQE